MNEPELGPIRRLAYAFYGVYALTVFAVCASVALLLLIVVPGQGRRAKIAAGTCRTAFVLAGLRPEVSGGEHLPEGHSVVVANHASYVDGLLLKGFLPGRFTFVIKGEMRNIPIVHFVLRRAGSRFVERFAANASARDARQIVKAARGGESLGFFPEGTFREEPGVGRFRAGAFMAAIKGEMPVVPIAISGSRRVLPAGRALPRPGPLKIELLPPICPGEPSWGSNQGLAEAARQRILAVLDEPDLVVDNEKIA